MAVRDDSSTAALIRLAGRRPEPSPAAAARVRAAVEGEWRRSVRRRSRRRAMWMFAAATAAALPFALWLRARPSEPRPAPPPTPVATVVRAIGAVRMTPHGLPSRSIAAGDTLLDGAIIETGTGGRVALQLSGGASVRIDAGSRALFETGSRLGLENGRIYVDRVRTVKAAAVAIATRWGVVRDIGTQFEVSATESSVAVRVREGTVRIEGASVSASVSRTESLHIDAAGTLTRGKVATHGEDWSWTETLAAPFAIEGAALDRFLNWVARERGLSWQFADAATTREAASVVLHGSIEGLSPAEALEAVLPTCGMFYSVRGDTLRIALAEASGGRR
jgi:FecR protein